MYAYVTIPGGANFPFAETNYHFGDCYANGANLVCSSYVFNGSAYSLGLLADGDLSGYSIDYYIYSYAG